MNLVLAKLTPYILKNYYEERPNLPQASGEVRFSGAAMTISASEVEAELNRPDRGKRTSVQGIGLLLLSLVIFAAIGLLNAYWTSMLILVVVLFIHESGHWLGMKIFGYRDVQMFFIPFFGAAVSGKESNVSSARRAVVLLLGPAPGIVLGIVSGVAFIKFNQPLLLQFGITSLFINGFNLLPIYPLDGGQLMETLIFSRHPITEIVFKILAAFALAGLAFWLSSIPLGILAVGTLIVTREAYFQAKIVGRMREKLKGKTIPEVEIIPSEYLESILPELVIGLPPKSINAKTLASRAASTWRRFSRQVPKLWPTLALLGTYIGIVVFGLGGAVALIAANRVAHEKVVITHQISNDGTTVPVEEKYWKQTKISEAQVDDQGLYDGPSMTWSLKGVKRTEGTWVKGFSHGEWKYFDTIGNLKAIIIFDNGRPQKYRVLKDGQFVEVDPEQWPITIKNSIQLTPKRTRLTLHEDQK